MEPFATSQDVQTSMQRTFNDAESAAVDGWLVEASDYVRDVAGGEAIYPTTQHTYTTWVLQGRVKLPFRFLLTVDGVRDEEGNTVPYKRFEDRVIVGPAYEGWALEVTVTTGLAEAPTVLKSYVIGMVEKRMQLTEMGVGLQFGGLSSVALDDFKLAFADGGDKAGFPYLPDTAQHLIRTRYGQTSWTVDSA